MQNELDRAGSHIVGRAGGRDRGRAERTPQLVIEPRRRRFLDHLLVAALRRAIALEQMNHVPVPIAEDLHLHMTRARQIFLEYEPAVAEGGQSLVAGGVERRRQRGRIGDDPHAAAAAAGGRLDQHRIAERRPLPAAKRAASCASP